MKKYSLIIFTFFLYSCSNNNTEEVNSNDNTDNSNQITIEPIHPKEVDEQQQDEKLIMLASFTVENYSAWEKEFKASTTASQNQFQVLYKTTLVEDDNTIGLVRIIRDVNEVKTKLKSDKFKEKQKLWGVTSDMNAMFIKTKWMTKETPIKSHNIAITLEVEDVYKWMKVFKEDKTRRLEADIYDIAICVDIENENLVTVLLATDDIENCKNVFESKETEQGLINAGVIGKPSISYWKVRY